MRARQGLALARLQLSIALGLSQEREFAPSVEAAQRKLDLPAIAEAEERALRLRPDLKQIQLQTEAAVAGRRAAKSAMVPRLNAFAGWEQDNPRLFGGGGNNWTAGIELQVDLFTGGQKLAQVQQARAMRSKLEALERAATDGVRLEVRKAWYDADALRQQIAVMNVAMAQSQEGLRIIETRYGSGLTTITELLRAEEARRRTQNWQALCGYQTALANLELATGTLGANSAVVAE